MKSVKVEGGFSRQHCSNKGHKCHSGSVKPTLLFKGSNKSSSAVPSHSSFSRLLEGGGGGVHLGPVDLHWFEKALHDEIGAKEVQCKGAHENNTHEVKIPSVEIIETPAEHRRAYVQQQAMAPQLFSPSPSLFTPDERRPVSQQTRKRHKDKQLPTNSPLHALRNDISTATPSLICVTPNKPAEKFDTTRQTPAHLNTSPSPGRQHTQEEPSPWGRCSAPKQTTPTFMKQLFKTPSTVSKLDDFSFSTSGQFLSTPLRMSVSLGADLDDSNLSWTSSLATPQGTTDKNNTLAASHTDRDQESRVIAKALFASTTGTPEHHTQQRRPTDPDGRTSTLHLQSLHMSEDEEETLDDTIRSDVADDARREKEERIVDDAEDGIKGDVAGGIKGEVIVVEDAGDEMQDDVGGKTDNEDCQRFSCGISVRDDPGDEETFTKEVMKGEHRLIVVEECQRIEMDVEEGTRREDVKGDVEAAGAEMQDEDPGGKDEEDRRSVCCHVIAHCAQNKQTFVGEQMKDEQRIGRKEDKNECLSFHSSNKAEDDADCTTKDLQQSPIPPNVLTEDSLKSVASVETTSTSQASRRASQRVQTDSQRSMENLTPTGSCVLDISDLSSFDKSRMEDTLAFFFLTPPQARSRLAKFKKQELEKDTRLIPVVSEISKSDGRTGSPEFTSLEECSVLEMSTGIGIEDLPQDSKEQETRQSKINISVISVREEDGSLKEFVENVSEIQQSQSLCTMMKCTDPNIEKDFSSLQPGDKNADKMNNKKLDNCEGDFKSTDDHSLKITTESPSSSDKFQQDTKCDLSPTASGQNVCSFTPFRQIRTVVSPPTCHVDSQDIFSQISPNYADALCHITDQVSESHQEQSALSPVPKDDKETIARQLHSMYPSCDKAVVSFKTPSVQLKIMPVLNDSKHPLSTVNAKCGVQTKDTLNNSKTSYEQEPLGQLFRMQPKAATTRRFFYPSTSTTAPKTGGQGTMRWITEAVLVQAEGEQQQQVAQETQLEHEKPIFNGTANKAPHSSGAGSSIYSSTPAPRNSAFVTFTNFMKTESKSVLGTANPAQSTPADHTNVQPQHKVMASIKSHQQAAHSNSAFANSHPNQTTPLSRRATIVRNNGSYGGARRRAGTHGLPAPKRLQVTVDEEQLGLNHRLNNGDPRKTCERGTLDSSRTLERIPETRTTLIRGVSRITASVVQSLQVESSVENTSAFLDTRTAKCSDGSSADEVRNIPDMIIASKHCTTAKTNSAKQEATTHNKQSLWKKEEEPDGAIPSSVSFASASGKAIGITESALDKAKQLWSEDKGEDIPVSVGFSSASGKAIQISNTALDKAKAVFDEDDGEQPLYPKVARKKNSPALGEKVLNTVPRKVGFTSASGKAVQISKSALQKAKLSFLEDEIKENVSSLDSASTSTGIVRDASFPKTVHFSTAGARTIQISESALQDAKLLQGKHQDTPLEFASAGAKRTLSAMGMPKMLSVENESQEISLAKKETALAKKETDLLDGSMNQLLHISTIDTVSASGISVSDHQKTKVFGGNDFQLDQMPSFTGFASASGNKIAISEIALQKAEKLFEDKNEIPPTVGFASAAGRPIELSESDLKKASSLLDESDNINFPASKKINAHLPSPQIEEERGRSNDSFVASRQSRFQQHSLNYQNLPKGFRPFKAPAKVHSPAISKTPLKVITPVEHFRNSVKLDTGARNKTWHLESIPETDVLALSPEVPKAAKRTATESSEFEEEFLSASQAQREIEAAEETESAYAFMQAEDDSFSQFEEPIVAKFNPSITSKSTGRSYVDDDDDAMTANMNAEKLEDLQSTASEIIVSINGQSVVHSNPPSQVLSQASDALDIAFVQSQSSAIEEIEIEEPILAVVHQEEELNQSENSQTGLAISVSAVISEAGESTISPKSSVHVVDIPCVGFQTARGNKVTFSEETLKKVKMLLAAEINTESITSPAEAAGDLGDPEHDSNKRVKAKDVPAFSGFHTARGKHIKVSEEALKSAQSLFLEDEIIGSYVLPQPILACQGFQTTKQDDVPESHQQKAANSVTVNETEKSLFFGFQTASGSKVTISEESLRRARCVFADAEEKFNSQFSIVPGTAKTVGNPILPLGFTTAGGSKVTISQESLNQVKSLRSDNCERFPPDDNTFTAPSSTRKGQPFLGFSTASGNKVSVSEAALQNAKKLFRESDDDKESSSPERKRRRLDRAPNDAMPVGFQTANGSLISVSQESLREAKHLFDESAQCSNSGPKDYVGFQTASGSKVAVSAESLVSAKQFLEEDETDAEPGTRGQMQPFLGFSTASGNKVPVSQAALENARRLFEEPDNDNSTMSIVFDKNTSDQALKRKRFGTGPDVSVPQGFQTASGSSVSISKSSLQKVKALLGNDVPQSCESGMRVPRVEQEGFQQLSPVQSVSFLPAPTETLIVSSSRPKASHTEAKQFRGDCCDAVVPQLEGKTNNDMHPHLPSYKTTTGTLKDQPSCNNGISFPKQDRSQQRFASPFTRQRTLAAKHSPSPFQPPYRTLQRKIRESRPTSGKPPETSQVVPEVPIPLLPPKPGKILSGSNEQEGMQPNKRDLDIGDNSFRSCGPLPKRARVEVGLDGDSSARGGTNGNVLGFKEQNRGLPLGEWKQARRNQASRIQSKKTRLIKPHPGNLFTMRQHSTRVPLYELVNGQPPQQYSRLELVEDGVLQSTLGVTSSSAEGFKFILIDYFSSEALETSEGLALGDGGRLVPDDAGMAGKQEFLNTLLDTPGVDPKLLTGDWVSNHYRWIVWKLAAMERAYPEHLAGRYLMPNRVQLQLKYRYDREIDHAHRSALKKILERDDAPSRRMVLCVAGVHQTETGVGENQEDRKDNEKISGPPVPTLELTDGWYAIKTIIDKPLARLVRAGKVVVGQKLCIYGAELVGSQDACSPLEVPASLRLKISANATRRARYDAHLGLQRYPQPFPLPLASLYPEGGTVGCVDVVVVRSYPMQYMEKHSEGGCTFRGRRAEEKEAGRFAQEKQKEMERLYDKIQEEYREKENKKVTSSRRSSVAQKLTAKQVETLHTGQELSEALGNTVDPGAMEVLLSERQMTLLNDYQCSLREKKQTELQGQFKRAMEDAKGNAKQENQIQRNVTPLLRLRITDYHKTPETDSQTYQMTVWRPTDDVLQLLSEGKRFKIFNVGTSSARFCVGSNNIQLSSTRATRYQAMAIPSTPATAGRAVYLPREVLRFTHAHQPGFMPVYGEVDAVGVVVMIQGAVNSPGSSSSEMVYLSNAEENVIAVKFWGGLQAHCLESLVKPGSFIAATSLQWRANSVSSLVPCLHAGDTSSVTQCPKADHLREALQDLQNQIKNPKGFAQSMKQLAMDMSVTQSRCPAPRTPRPDSGPVGMSSAMPWSDHRPSGSNARLSTTPECCYSSDGGTGAPGLPNTNQRFSSPTPENWTNQFRPHAASTSLPTMMPKGIASTPGTKGLTVHPSPNGLVSTTVSDPQDKRRLDAGRRFDLLSRVPSPPPLSPLPTPMSSRVMRGFRLPSCRKSIPQHRSSYGSSIQNTPGLKGQGLGVRRSNLYNRGQNVRDVSHNESESYRESSENTKMVAVNTPVKHSEGPVVKDLRKTPHPRVRSGTENSPEEDMTPSQQQVQEVLGMSYKSLGEIDWEWTQQMDLPSPTSPQPSLDFSYDTPSQSSPVKEEELSVAPPNTDNEKLTIDDTKLNEEKTIKEYISVLPAFGEDGQNENREDKASASKRKLGRRTCRGKVRRNPSVKILSPSDSNDPRIQEPFSRKEQMSVDGGGDHLKNKHHASESEIKGREEQTDADGDKDVVKDEEEKGTRLQETAVDEAEDSLKDEKKIKVDPATGQQQPPRAAAGKRKRRTRSRVDLSILEQSSLLGEESGEPTRRLTRSASRRSAAGGFS